MKSIPFGIKAYVDFVFKKMFGSPENSAALIGLLNAILELPRPITDVTIQNPFSYKEFETAKFVTLDVKAVDSAETSKGSGLFDSTVRKHQRGQKHQRKHQRGQASLIQKSNEIDNA